MTLDNADNTGMKVYINGVLVNRNESWTAGTSYMGVIPVAKGDVMTFGGWEAALTYRDISRGEIPSIRFVPFK